MELSNKNIVGLTSTIPVEIVLAAGLIPVDLNNLFITDINPEKLLKQAEADGFSHNICAWIKGIYSIVVNNGIKTVIAVTGGDCSNTVALSELLVRKGVRVITFDYPKVQDKKALKSQMDILCKELSTDWDKVLETKIRLDKIRRKLTELDRLTFEENIVKGVENHLFLVSSSDFKSDPEVFDHELNEFLNKVKKERGPVKDEIRVGYLGVPPVFSNFYETIESLGARVVFNETQRQFSMPFYKKDIIDQYLRYTYPYEIQARIDDINEAIQERQLDGLIHYTQTFCFRQINDIILKESLPVPILTLEGDRPGDIDARTAIRLETFIEILRDKI